MNREEARARAQALVSQMTLEEQASQLRYDAPAIPRLGVPAYNWWNEALHGVARAGVATMFPQAIGMAAAFDAPAMEEVGRAIGIEGRAKYNEAAARGDRNIYKGLTFWSPNVNIFRDPPLGPGPGDLRRGPGAHRPAGGGLYQGPAGRRGVPAGGRLRKTLRRALRARGAAPQLRRQSQQKGHGGDLPPRL